MIREKVLSMGIDSATLLVKDTLSNNTLRILRRISLLGWTDEDVSSAGELYRRFQKFNLSGFVSIHTVLVQGSFLNVVTDFCAGGDLNTYLEDKLKEPLPETQVVQWLLSISVTLRSLHCDTHCPFYGLSLERVFFGDRGNILLGLPLPFFLYFKQMADRKKDGVILEKEYPPEALQMRWYHPELSDVWHLGLIAQKLLSARTQFSLRSSSAQQLVMYMMEPDLKRRMPLDEVIKSLKHIIRDAKPSEHPPPELSQLTLGNKFVVRDRLVSPTLLQDVAPDMKETQSTSKGHPWAPQLPNGALAPKVSEGTNNIHDADGAVVRQENVRGPQDSWHLRAMKQFEELQRMNAVSPGRVHNHVGPQDGCTGRSRRGLTLQPINTGRVHGAKKQVDQFLDDSFSADEAANLIRQKNIRTHIKQWNRKRIEAIALNANQHNNLVVTDRSSVVIVAPRPAAPAASPKDRLTPRAAANARRAYAQTPTPTPKAADTNPKTQVNLKMARTPSPSKASQLHEAGPMLPQQRGQVQPPPPMLSNIHQDSVVLRTPSTNSSLSIAKPPAREPPLRMKAKHTSDDRPRSPPAVPLSRGDSLHFAKASLQSSISGAGSCPSASEVSSRNQETFANDRRPPHALPSVLVSGTGKTNNLSPGATGTVMDAGITATLEWTINGLRSVLRSLLKEKSVYREAMTAVSIFVASGQEGCLNPQHNEVFLYRLKEWIPNEALFMAVASLCAQLASLERLNQSTKEQRHFTGNGKEKVIK
ncbi:unnamed protein product [Phytomonas sp. EM1]|nr:unnamed protein product [Phytomonas sp. EM1]|eukprot:CCW62325.1 unnamed protein product [Phytomonas sp. isolate EM1]